MTKDEVKKALDGKGIDYDPEATKADLLARLKDHSEPEKASFKVVRRLCEGGEIYQPGDQIKLTERRAEALGPLLKPASE